MRVVATLFLVVAASARAQTTEIPIPFDSAQRVLAVTPVVAERLHLATPAWPVAGTYREARLYSVDPGGGFVLVVERSGGALQRFALSSTQRSALRDAIDAGMSTSGRPSAESAADLVSEPAGNAFARHQTFLAAVVYGPLAASLANDPSAAGAAYLIVTGGTFFASYGAQSNHFTRAQSDLAGGLGLAAGTGGWLLGYAATNNSDKGVRGVALGSALAGTIAGAALGQSLSDAEAHAAILGIKSVAALALATTTISGVSERGTAAAVAVVGALGYPLGVSFPRRAGFTVTAGDVEATGTAGLIGVLIGETAMSPVHRPSPRQYGAYLGTGYLAGIVVGSQVLARPFDLTQSEANILTVGAVAGGLLGAALPVLMGSSSNSALPGAASVGAILGAAAIASSFPRASVRRVGGVPARRLRDGGLRLTMTPESAVAAFAGVPGHHVLARLTF